MNCFATYSFRKLMISYTEGGLRSHSTSILLNILQPNFTAPGFLYPTPGIFIPHIIFLSTLAGGDGFDQLNDDCYISARQYKNLNCHATDGHQLQNCCKNEVNRRVTWSRGQNMRGMGGS